MNRFNEDRQFNRSNCGRFDRRCDCINWVLWGFCPPRRCIRNDFDPGWDDGNRRREGRIRRDLDPGWNDDNRRREGRIRREQELNDFDPREFELRNEIRQGDINRRLNFDSENNRELFNDRFSPTISDAVGLANITTSGLVDGLIVPAGGRIPLTTLKVNDENLITLNDNTIRFNRCGLYKIDFVVDTYTQNPTATEQIALGFKRVIDSTTLFTAGMRITTPSNQIVGTGVIRVRNVRELYELVNLNTNPIRLLSFRGETVLTSADVVNMSITYLND